MHWYILWLTLASYRVIKSVIEEISQHHFFTMCKIQQKWKIILVPVQESYDVLELHSQEKINDGFYSPRTFVWFICSGMMIALGDFDKSNDDVNTKFWDFWIISMWKDPFRPLPALGWHNFYESVLLLLPLFLNFFISWLDKKYMYHLVNLYKFWFWRTGSERKK